MYVIIYNMQAIVNKKQTREYNNMKQNTLGNLILIAYMLMMIVSLVSAVDLFTLSHPSFAFGWIMSVAIEISIAALLIVNRKVPGIKSVLYVLGFITLFQICANTYSAYIHIENISPFAELFALDEWEVIDQKRMLAFATGGVLPAICLALIYIQNEVREQTETNKTNNKEPDDKAYNIEGVQIPSDEDAEDDEDGGEAEEASSSKSHIDQPISESESEEVPTPQQQDESTKDADINTESEEQAEITTEQLSETDESNDQSEDTVEPEAAVEEPKKRKYTKKSTSKSTSKTAKKTSKKTKTSKSNKKPKASKKAEEQTSADEVSVTDVPESDPDSQSQESVAELAERLNDIRRGKHNPVSNGYSMML